MGKSHSKKPAHAVRHPARTIHCHEAAHQRHTPERVMLVAKDARRYFSSGSNRCTITCKHACKAG